MRAFARFILVKSHDNKELLINVAQIEWIMATKDPEVCEIHIIGDEEESFFLANHTMQDLIFVLDEAADVHIAGARVRLEGLTLPEVESIGHKQD
jgi:hypothetical protein